MNEVKIGSYGFIFIPVDIKQTHSATLKGVTYKVDTGANRTTISSDQLYDLGYNLDWIKQVNYL